MVPDQRDGIRTVLRLVTAGEFTVDRSWTETILVREWDPTDALGTKAVLDVVRCGRLRVASKAGPFPERP